MKIKLFIAFSGIIFIGFVINIIFASLIYRDFVAYSDSLRKDQLGWVRSSIETAYDKGEWNHQTLLDSLHWGLMLGFYIRVYDLNGREIINSEKILNHLHPEMKKRMEETIDLKKFHGEEIIFDLHPSESDQGLSGHKAITGRLVVRSLAPWGIARLKEEAFKKKMIIFSGGSIIFVTIASLFTAYLLSHFISRPFIKLREITDRLRDGDLKARIEIKGKDEVSALAESFNRMAERLQKEDELRRHLSSQLTHELRTPLTVISANIEAMKDNIIEQERALKNIEPEIERLRALIEGMEEVVKAEASLFTTLNPAEIELYDFIKDRVKGLEQEFSKKGLYLRVKGEPLVVRTDPEKLTIIIRNLLKNSLRFTEKGGVIILIKDKEGKAEITVSDTGRGIEPSRLPFIFKRFYRDEASPGLGIGLSIVDGLVRLLGGTIEVKSVPGEGTSFRILLRDLK
ncbi:MAG: HAMP domain-containing histidine kinase [Thermodesulfovibrionales bacterium]|nr:HAMP domain-containing histidine kinase [Thermodesulfovibrionales bacterium]